MNNIIQIQQKQSTNITAKAILFYCQANNLSDPSQLKIREWIIILEQSDKTIRKALNQLKTNFANNQEILPPPKSSNMVNFTTPREILPEIPPLPTDNTIHCINTNVNVCNVSFFDNILMFLNIHKVKLHPSIIKKLEIMEDDIHEKLFMELEKSLLNPNIKSKAGYINIMINKAIKEEVNYTVYEKKQKAALSMAPEPKKDRQDKNKSPITPKKQLSESEILKRKHRETDLILKKQKEFETKALEKPIQLSLWEIYQNELKNN